MNGNTKKGKSKHTILIFLEKAKNKGDNRKSFHNSEEANLEDYGLISGNSKISSKVNSRKESENNNSAYFSHQIVNENASSNKITAGQKLAKEKKAVFHNYNELPVHPAKYTDSDNSEDEGMEDYKVGGYHPVHVG
jgi:hypothetical protein